MPVLEIVDSDQIKFKLTYTLSLYDWKLIKDALDDRANGNPPALKFSTAIREMVDKATQEFYPDKDQG